MRKYFALIFVLSFTLAACLPGANKVLEKRITSFEECVAAGNAVMESYPRQCRSQAGDLFIEEVDRDSAEIPDSNQDDNVLCIEIYDPVCGQINVQCIKAPCPPIWETFSNDCFANVRGAKNIQKGTCEDLDLN